MKKLLSMLSILTLASTSIGTTISTNTNNNTKISNNSKYYSDVKYIKSPIGNKSLLTVSAGYNTWGYITINLGKMKQEQIMGIGSKDNDSYTDHKVPSYNYYYKDDKAGIHHGPNFRNWFINDKVNANWDFATAEHKAALNFTSTALWGAASHTSMGTIKFLWHYNNNSELLIQIVGTLLVRYFLSSVDSVASSYLGNTFIIYYRN